MILLLAVIIGLLIGLFVSVSLPNVVYPYLALIILCTLDSLIGGIRSRYANRYSAGLFITGWLGNCLAAVVMNALGDALGINLALPVQILLGMRIFRNIANLRRIWLRRVEKRQRTIRVWMDKTGKPPAELPLEALSGSGTERSKKADELRQQAKKLRLEADSLLNEADTLLEQEALDSLLAARGEAARSQSEGTEAAAPPGEDENKTK